MQKVVTTETCPVCQSEMKVEHGTRDRKGSLIHIEHCPECGDMYPVVGYDCPNCAALSGQEIDYYEIFRDWAKQNGYDLEDEQQFRVAVEIYYREVTQ